MHRDLSILPSRQRRPSECKVEMARHSHMLLIFVPSGVEIRFIVLLTCALQDEREKSGLETDVSVFSVRPD